MTSQLRAATQQFFSFFPRALVVLCTNSQREVDDAQLVHLASACSVSGTKTLQFFGRLTICLTSRRSTLQVRIARVEIERATFKCLKMAVTKITSNQTKDN